MDVVPVCRTDVGMRNRITELRNARGWSMRELAARTNSSASSINALEKGKTRLNSDWIERLCKAFSIEPEELLGFDDDKSTVFLSDDVEKLTEEQLSNIEIKLKETQFPYRVMSSVLDQLGILPGATLVTDVSQEQMRSIVTGDIVISQLHVDMRRFTLLRQFIEPSILITNSSRENAPILNLRTDDVGIKGIVVAAHNEFRRNPNTE